MFASNNFNRRFSRLEEMHWLRYESKLREQRLREQRLRDVIAGRERETLAEHKPPRSQGLQADGIVSEKSVPSSQRCSIESDAATRVPPIDPRTSSP